MLTAAGADAVDISPGRSGSFEITVDGKPVFSKLESGRFPDEDEIRAFAAG